MNGRESLAEKEVTNVPTEIKAASAYTFTTLRAGVSHTCGLQSDGSAYCFGELVCCRRSVLASVLQIRPVINH